jgi:hypothetical protein
MRSRGESRFGRYLEGVGIRSLIGEIRPVAERRRAVALARHSVRSKGSRSRRSPRVWADRARRSTRTSTTPPARRRGAVKAGCAAAVAPTRSRATARATRTRSARPAIPARSSAVGPLSVLEAMLDWRSRYGRRPSSYDWSRAHARRRGGEALARFAGGVAGGERRDGCVRQLERGPRRLGHDLKGARPQS